jgi:tight adherence protein B
VTLDLITAALVFVAVFCVLGYLLTARRSSAGAEHRISRLARPVETKDKIEGGGVLRSGTSRLPLLRTFLARSSFSDRWRLDMEQAGLRMKVSEYMLMRLALGAAACVVLLLLLGGGFFGLLLTILGTVAGFMAPALFVKRRKGSRRKAINGQIVEMLEMVSNSLRSGFAFVQAIELAAKQLGPPMKDELEILLSDMSLGARSEDALRGLAERTDSVDVELLVTTILVQRTSGGNLAEVLDNAAKTIRERERLQGDIRALTAQQRMTGVILSLYPIVLGALIFVISPGLVSVLWEEEGGRVLLGVAIVLQTLGYLSIRRILTLEV